MLLLQDSEGGKFQPAFPAFPARTSFCCLTSVPEPLCYAGLDDTHSSDPGLHLWPERRCPCWRLPQVHVVPLRPS